MNPIPKEFWSLQAQKLLDLLSCKDSGLSTGEAERRLKMYGSNAITSHAQTAAFSLLARQFKSPLTFLLVIASGLSAGLGEFSDAVIIMVIILISGLLGYWQEKRSADTIDKLMKRVAVKCRVVRDAIQKDSLLEEVVPGDIVILTAGDIIPADCMLLESQELFVDEAVFTGETYPAEKAPGVVSAATSLSKRTNVLWMGSHVVSGKARALVVATGKQTTFGNITEKLRATAAETNFEKSIRRFGYFLMEITLLLVLIIFAINILLHKPALDSFLFSLALAVGLTPQLLPAIISVNLSTGARAMARQQVIVKRLSSIENFGSMNILCSDKTGTITEGKVVVHEALDIQGNRSGKTLQYAWLNASMQQGFVNPLDRAICDRCAGQHHDFIVRSEVPYDFIRKRLTVQITDANEELTICKGALTHILEICTQAETQDGQVHPIDDYHANIEETYNSLSIAGYRVLGVAYKKASEDKDVTRVDECDMTFMGFITFFDVLKTGVEETIKNLHALGVQWKMITGDNALVAESLARKIGICKPVVVTGLQLKEMSDRALLQQVVTADIFAEVEPNQKERIVLFLQKSGNVVGFMGDGINDAAALHAADVGISVDSAVDIAKEAADIVLLSKDLDVLRTGILEGRKTFLNTMKYIFMATSANFGNMFSMAAASLFVPFLPLLPKQILLTNLLTDFPEMAIATDTVDADALQKPRRLDIRFIQRFMIVFGLLSAIFDFLTFAVLLIVMRADEKTFRTGWFLESVISASLVVLLMRTKLPVFKSLPGKSLLLATSLTVLVVIIIPLTPFASILGFNQVSFLFYGWVLLIVGTYVICAEVVKQWFYRTMKNNE